MAFVGFVYARVTRTVPFRSSSFSRSFPKAAIFLYDTSKLVVPALAVVDMPAKPSDSENRMCAMISGEIIESRTNAIASSTIRSFAFR